jgi:hypothetical protein
MEEDIKIKQTYLREHILDKGYDAEAFVDFLYDKKENGNDISIWTLEELQSCVTEYVQKCEDLKQKQAAFEEPIQIDRSTLNEVKSNPKENFTDVKVSSISGPTLSSIYI